MRCPKWLPSGKCKICGWAPSDKPQFSLESDVDIWKLADELKVKKETELRNKIYA